jgi:hypothetical protein
MLFSLAFFTVFAKHLLPDDSFHVAFLSHTIKHLPVTSQNKGTRIIQFFSSILVPGTVTQYPYPEPHYSTVPSVLDPTLFSNWIELIYSFSGTVPYRRHADDHYGKFKCRCGIVHKLCPVLSNCLMSVGLLPSWIQTQPTTINADPDLQHCL